MLIGLFVITTSFKKFEFCIRPIIAFGEVFIRKGSSLKSLFCLCHSSFSALLLHYIVRLFPEFKILQMQWINFLPPGFYELWWTPSSEGYIGSMIRNIPWKDCIFLPFPLSVFLTPQKKINDVCIQMLSMRGWIY